MSRLLKAQQTSLTQQSYYVQVETIRPPRDESPVPPEVEEARLLATKEADSILAAAEAQAAELIRQAQEEASRMLDLERERVQAILHAEVEEAKAVGYQVGHEAAVHTVEAAYAGKFEEIEHLYQSAVTDRQKYLAASESLILEMACSIAKKIMLRESSVDREWVLSVVRAALEEIHDAGKIEVRVHPDDFELVHAGREGLRKEVPGQTELIVLPDRVVEAGGCVVQTAFGNIDARIDTQLEEVRKALQEVAASLES